MGENISSIEKGGLNLVVASTLGEKGNVKKQNPLPNLITRMHEERDRLEITHKLDNPEPTEVNPNKNKYISVAEKLKEIQSLLGKRNTEKNELQLEFQFAFQFSAETLARFSKTTKAVEDSLTGETQKTYAEIRQQIAMQFKIGGNISHESLIGFAKASEGLFEVQEWFNGFLKISQRLLKNGVSEDWNDFFESLSGLFPKTEENEAFETFINRFLDNWLRKIFPHLEQTDSSTSEINNSPMRSPLTSRNTLQFQFEFRFEFSLSIDIQMAVRQLDQQQDPIILDLDGDGIELTSVEKGVIFDISGKGAPVQTAWVRGGDALLALDRNENGVIDNGLELFGDQRGSANGFEELRKLDTNRDDYISKEDKDFERLRLWKDNGDGVSSPEELFTLTQLGIERISLNYKNVSFLAEGNNKITQKSFFIKNDGTVGRVVDALLNYRV